MGNQEYEISSGNVYDDLGSTDSSEMQVKAELACVILKYMEIAGLTQQQLADKLGIDQPRISRILRGDFRGVSLEKFLYYLRMIGNDIRIEISESKDRESVGHLNVNAA